jgi:hypothetical protein
MEEKFKETGGVNRISGVMVSVLPSTAVNHISGVMVSVLPSTAVKPKTKK